MTAIVVTMRGTAPSTGNEGIEASAEARGRFNVYGLRCQETAKHALDVYRFLKGEGVEFIQFTPVVERCRTKTADSMVCASPGRVA
jgi:sulfatase maturation enzyme AslB (radical SAM superfamily)